MGGWGAVLGLRMQENKETVGLQRREVCIGSIG